jgi:hypothetical protein
VSPIRALAAAAAIAVAWEPVAARAQQSLPELAAAARAPISGPVTAAFDCAGRGLEALLVGNYVAVLWPDAGVTLTREAAIGRYSNGPHILQLLPDGAALWFERGVLLRRCRPDPVRALATRIRLRGSWLVAFEAAAGAVVSQGSLEIQPDAQGRATARLEFAASAAESGAAARAEARVARRLIWQGGLARSYDRRRGAWLLGAAPDTTLHTDGTGGGEHAQAAAALEIRVGPRECRDRRFGRHAGLVVRLTAPEVIWQGCGRIAPL